MKIIIVTTYLFLSGILATCVIAQSNNWADYGLTLDDVKYLSTQEKQEILNLPTPEQTTQLAALKKHTLSNIKSLPVSSQGSLGLTTQEPSTIVNTPTANCFNYYTFGSVEADMTAQSSGAVSGMTMGFFGNIKNNNRYPIVAGTLYVKIMKNVGGEKNPNGPDVVDQFIALDNITIPAHGSIPAKFTWKVPAFAETGNYQLVTYFLSDKKFNLLGLSFTDDVVGNSFNFTVVGEKTGMMFDKTSVIINENPYYFAAYPPRIPLQKDAHISLKIKNTTNIPQTAQVQWKLYKWDSMGPDNLVREFTTTTKLKPNTSNSLQLTIPEKDAPVYYLVGTLTYKDTKSIVNLRFVREGVDKVRLNFPSITTYPIKANEPTTLFTCLHNSGQSAQVPNNKVILELKDDTGKVVESYTYEGVVTGEMMAVKKDFTLEKTLDNFSVHAALYTDNKLVDESTMQYDCTLLDPARCPTKIETDRKTPTQVGTQETKSPQNMFINILLSLLALSILGILIARTKKKKNTLLPLILLFFIPLCLLQPSVAEAKEVIWTSNPTVKLDSFWNWSGTTIENQGTGWDKALDNPSVSIKYKAEIRNKDTGALIADGSSIPVGTKLILSFLPHLSEDISWFGTGYSGDSPYGEWRAGSTPPAVACNTKDFVVHYHYIGYLTCNGIGTFTIPEDNYYDAYIPLVVSPPATRTLTNTNGMTCSPLSTTSWECTVTSPGIINPLFTVSATSGKFYYRYWDFRNLTKAHDGVDHPAGCYGNNIPLKVDAGTITGEYICTDSTGLSNRKTVSTPYSLEVPVQTISYNLTATVVPPANNPPLPPTITGPTTGTVLTQYTFGIQSTDPDGDTIKYIIDWTNTGTPLQPIPSTGYVTSGTTLNTDKAWSTAGTLFTFRARAEDEHGLQSDWTSHSIILTNISTLTINTAGTGGGTTTGAGTYTPGTLVTATATPNTLSTFTGWSGDCNPSGQVTMNTDKTCIATFTLIPITATCSPSPALATFGHPINWTVNNILGGTGVYSFLWSGTDSLSGTTNPLPKTYTTEGTKNASVIITSGDQTKTVSCTEAVVTSLVDVCNNIEDNQSSLPAGLVNTGGNCVCGS